MSVWFILRITERGNELTKQHIYQSDMTLDVNIPASSCILICLSWVFSEFTDLGVLGLIQTHE